tara:strand:+ start:22062 stop:22925 length:864 start_codon:yes stop_codon:yes gene_type:complete
MNFGVLTFSQDTFAGVGSTNVTLVAPDQTLTTTLGDATIQGTVTITNVPSFLNSLAIGNTTIIGNAIVSVSTFIGNNETHVVTTLGSFASITGDANIDVGLLNAPSLYDTATYDNGTFGSVGLKANLSVNAPTISGDANIDISETSTHDAGFVTFLLTTTFNPDITIRASANVELPSILLSGAVGEFQITGNATFTLSSVSANASVGQLQVVGNANLILPSFVTTTAIQNQYIIIIVNAEGYAKERTVYVDFKDNHIRNTVFIEEQNRTVLIPEKQHNVRSKTLLAA